MDSGSACGYRSPRTGLSARRNNQRTQKNLKFKKTDHLRHTLSFGAQLIYNLTATQAIGGRYGAAAYEITSSLGSTETYMGDIFATYRYSWRAGKPTRIYIEAGLGASDSIPLYDTGTKFAFTAALGVKRFIGERFSLGLESRGVSFTQKESLLSTQNVTAAINEFSLVLGYLF